MDINVEKILLTMDIKLAQLNIESVSMGIGTFIESYYNTTTAKILIYNAWWFLLFTSILNDIDFNNINLNIFHLILLNFNILLQFKYSWWHRLFFCYYCWVI